MIKAKFLIICVPPHCDAGFSLTPEGSKEQFLKLNSEHHRETTFEVIYKIIMLTLGYNMYMMGYKQGKSAIITFLKTGVLNRMLDLVSIVGLMVVGSMAVNNITYNLSLIGWEVQNEIGSVAFNLQETVLDALLPGILPLALVLGVRELLKKRTKPTTIILLMFVLAFITVGLGALCGAY